MTDARSGTAVQWIAVFEDEPDRLSLRAALFDAHVEYLSSRRQSIRLAGALRSDTDAPWVGGLWIICADSRAAAVECCESDPFFVHGLRRGYELYQWGRAPCFGEVGTILL